MKFLRAVALSLFVCALASAQSAGVFTIPEQFFTDSYGNALAGGSIYFCVAGTTCPGNPQATYTDASGSVQASNPVVLDSAGRASIWLSGSGYKVVAKNSLGVTQWTADNVVLPGLSFLAGTGSLSALTVTGNVTIGGTLGVTGAVTLSGNVSIGGTLSVGTISLTGALNANSLAIAGASTLTGNVSIGGTLGVTGAATFSGGETVTGGLATDTLSVGGSTLATVITTAIAAAGSPIALNGTVAISNISSVGVTNGNWIIFTFGTVSGSRVRVAWGSGTASNGGTIPVPSGFNSTNLQATASLNAVATTSGNQLDNINISVASGGVVTATASDNSGHNFTTTANWYGVAWITGY